MLTADKITNPITFNVRERGRVARGQDRNFNTRALAKLINSASVQERVKHGDMFGYYGHWPRRKLGMATPEGGIVDGKVISVVPALRTIELSADDDGNVTHRAQFLDTPEGRACAKLYLTKAGGFSTAITPVRHTSPIIPAEFDGIDYVLEPNFTTNRGHKVVLDGVEGEEEGVVALLDSAVMDASGIAQLFDSLHAQHLLALETLERVTQQNIDMVDRLAKGKGAAVLDGVLLEDSRVAPMRFEPADDFERFRNIDLAGLQALKKETKPDNSPEAGFLRSRFNWKG